MTLAAEQEMQHIGETKAMADHDHDIVHELNKRLDSIWRYDQYIANADADEDLQELWKQCKQEDVKVADKLKRKIAEHIKKECF